MLSELAGTDLGTRRVAYTDRDAILYALSVGAAPDDLDLVFERRLHVLPTFGLTLGLWACDAASARGAFEPARSLHGSQRLQVLRPLPPAAELTVSARIAAVWDKGRSAVLDIEAESEYFTATYAIFLPGQGGFGGEPGPRAETPVQGVGPVWTADHTTSPGQAALYRLTGDRHLIHIDPEAARAAGFAGPILHGLCTLGIAARELAAAVGAEPWQLTSIAARFSGPVQPGATLSLRAHGSGPVAFTADADGASVLGAGVAAFG